ncbi:MULTISPECIES: hypothetical protein, partial [unclassified Leptolyngbya]
MTATPGKSKHQLSFYPYLFRTTPYCCPQVSLWVDKGSTEEIRIALRIGKVSDDYATGDSQMTSNI